MSTWSLFRCKMRNHSFSLSLAGCDVTKERCGRFQSATCTFLQCFGFILLVLYDLMVFFLPIESGLVYLPLDKILHYFVRLQKLQRWPLTPWFWRMAVARLAVWDSPSPSQDASPWQQVGAASWKGFEVTGEGGRVGEGRARKRVWPLAVTGRGWERGWGFQQVVDGEEPSCLPSPATISTATTLTPRSHPHHHLVFIAWPVNIISHAQGLVDLQSVFWC